MSKIRGFFLVNSGKSLTFVASYKKYYHDETTKDH